MDRLSRRLAAAGALSLTVGIVSIVSGVTVGVLSVVNGGALLRERKALKR